MSDQKISVTSDLVTRHIYQSSTGEVEWGELMISLLNEGFTSSEVYVIMNNVREEGVA